MLALTYGMMPSAKIDRFAERASAEHVEEAEQPAALLVHDGVHDRPVHAGDRHEDADAVDRQHARRVKRMRRRSSGTLPMLAEGGEGGHGSRVRSMRRLRLRRCADEDDLAARLLDLLRRGLARTRARDTVTALVSSPSPRILMRSKRPLTRPRRDERRLVDVRAGREDLEVAHVDLGRDASGTGCVKPRFGRRRWIGVWPPSKWGLKPRVRAYWPFWPRPAVLPRPEPTPRPRRVFVRGRPGGLCELAQRISHDRPLRRARGEAPS